MTRTHVPGTLITVTLSVFAVCDICFSLLVHSCGIVPDTISSAPELLEYVLRLFVIRDLCWFRGCRHELSLRAVKSVFAPVKRGNRLGTSRNESGYYSRRGTQITSPLLEGGSCHDSGLLCQLLFRRLVSKVAAEQTGASCLVYYCTLART